MATAEQELKKLAQSKRKLCVILDLMAEYKRDSPDLCHLAKSLHSAASEAFERAKNEIEKIEQDTIEKVLEMFSQLGDIFDQISGFLTFMFMSDRKEKTVFTPSDVAVLKKRCDELNKSLTSDKQVYTNLHLPQFIEI